MYIIAGYEFYHTFSIIVINQKEIYAAYLCLFLYYITTEGQFVFPIVSTEVFPYMVKQPLLLTLCSIKIIVKEIKLLS